MLGISGIVLSKNENYYSTVRFRLCASKQKDALLISTGKNCQPIPPGTSNMFERLWMTTELAQMKIFALGVQEPGGAAIIFPKSGRNQNPTPL